MRLALTLASVDAFGTLPALLGDAYDIHSGDRTGMHDATPVPAAYLYALADILLQMKGTETGDRARYEDGGCLVTADRDGSGVEVSAKPWPQGDAVRIVASSCDGDEVFEDCGSLVRHMEAEAAACFGGVHVFTFEMRDGEGRVRAVHVKGLDLVDARGHAEMGYPGEGIAGLVAARTPAVFAASAYGGEPVGVSAAAARALSVSTEVRRPGDGADQVFWFTYNNVLESGQAGPPVRMPIRALDLADAQGLLRLIRPARGIRLIRIEITTLLGFLGTVDPEDGPMLLVAPGVLLRDAVESSLAIRAA